MRKKNKHIVLNSLLVEDYAAEGKSIARIDGKVIFIEKVVPGDVVDVRLAKNKRLGRRHPYFFHSYSKERVQPFCPHFGICGGCKWQMLPYQKQLQYKQQQTIDQLKRIGQVSFPEIIPILGCEETRYYRNKLEYTFTNKRYLTNEEVKNPDISGTQDVAGFHAPGMFDKVVDIDVCFLQEEPTNRIRKLVKAFAVENSWPFYDIRMHQGFLRTMQVRLCSTGELMVNIVVGMDKPEWLKALLAHVMEMEPSITTLLYTVNLKHNDSLNDLEPQVHFGEGYVVEKLENFNFKIGPKSFFQTNTKQAEKLYKVVRDFAALNGTQTVYDLYCGTGSIGIFLSKGAKKIIGVESVGEAIEDAKVNAAMNNIDTAHFFAGNAEDVCNEMFFAEHGRPDVIITDPPRVGMHDALVQQLLKIAAPVIVYVSCNPATQARDLKLLNAKYTIEKLQPVDMFPHTHHIENVVKLRLRDHKD